MDYKGTENNGREVAVITERKRLRAFMAADLYDTRQRLELTQEEMSELLDINVRSYIYLEHGDYMCSTRTLLLYLLRCREDAAGFLQRAGEVMGTPQAVEAK